MINLLRPLRPSVFQVIIRDIVTAVLRFTGDSCEIWVLQDAPTLLVTLTDETRLSLDPVRIARRLADGEFDKDMRFEVTTNPEPSWAGDQYIVSEYAIPSQKHIDTFTTEDGYGAVAAAREAQAFSLEERWAMDAELGR